MSSDLLADAPECVDSGDTAWLLICAVLVLSMIPGLGLFEAGMLPRRNALSLVTQVFVGLGVVALLWQLFTFSLAFGPDHGGVIGDFSWALYRGLEDHCFRRYAPTTPAIAFATFQLMFAAIAPLLLTGAVAGRMRLSVLFVFVVYWHLIVYVPVAHWMWADNGFLKTMGALDFAGGIVLHTTSGTSALVLSAALGRRSDWHRHGGEDEPHNLMLATSGALWLFFGWYGFNAGSAFAAGSTAASTVATTTTGGITASLVWVALALVHSRAEHRGIEVAAALNGFIAGLAGTTPISGYCSPSYAIAVGVIMGVVSFYGVIAFKRLKIDDALDVSSVHGLTGIAGSLCIGIFADTSVNPNGGDGLVTGHGMLLAYQLFAVLVTVAWSAAFTGLFCYVLPLLFNRCDPSAVGRQFLRVQLDVEVGGFDAKYGHGVAYHSIHSRRHDDNEDHDYDDDDDDDDDDNGVDVGPSNDFLQIQVTKVKK
jgi:ammonium transporter, Amt family